MSGGHRLFAGQTFAVGRDHDKQREWFCVGGVVPRLGTAHCYRIRRNRISAGVAAWDADPVSPSQIEARDCKLPKGICRWRAADCSDVFAENLTCHLTI